MSHIALGQTAEQQRTDVSSSEFLRAQVRAAAARASPTHEDCSSHWPTTSFANFAFTQEPNVLCTGFTQTFTDFTSVQYF